MRGGADCEAADDEAAMAREGTMARRPMRGGTMRGGWEPLREGRSSAATRGAPRQTASGTAASTPPHAALPAGDSPT